MLPDLMKLMCCICLFEYQKKNPVSFGSGLPVYNQRDLEYHLEKEHTTQEIIQYFAQMHWIAIREEPE